VELAELSVSTAAAVGRDSRSAGVAVLTGLFSAQFIWTAEMEILGDSSKTTVVGGF
jgi:hypothetical protein